MEKSRRPFKSFGHGALRSTEKAWVRYYRVRGKCKGDG